MALAGPDEGAPPPRGRGRHRLTQRLRPARAAALTPVTGFGTNPGNLNMWKYVPDGLPAGRPLVVALHGCSQSAASYDAEPGWVKYAEAWDFALVLPEQKSANNGSLCFNWFEAGDYTRGQGEALSIKQMVDRMKADHGVDATRVFVTGLSSGGALSRHRAARPR